MVGSVVEKSAAAISFPRRSFSPGNRRLRPMVMRACAPPGQRPTVVRGGSQQGCAEREFYSLARPNFARTCSGSPGRGLSGASSAPRTRRQRVVGSLSGLAQRRTDEGGAGFDCLKAGFEFGMEQVPDMDHLGPDLQIDPDIGGAG